MGPRLQRLDGYVDVAGGTLRPTGPGSEEIHVGGRVVEKAADNFLDGPGARDPQGNQMISGEPCGYCSRARGLSPRHFVLGPIGDLIIHA